MGDRRGAGCAVLVDGLPLGSDGPLATDGPYAESKEHLAGFFVISCATRERAEEVAAQFAGPGDTVELRPAMSAGGGDA